MSKQLIASTASYGGAKLMLVSCASLVVIILVSMWLQQFGLITGLALIVAGLGVFAGWAKLAEPVYLLQLDEQGLRYFHRKGSWLLPWSSFLYSGVPEFNNNDLAFIGFKVTNYDQFLAHLPLRLAVAIMTEQRAIYLDVVRQSCANGQCGSEVLSEVDNYTTAQQVYTGIKAAFCWRMQRLQQTTQFDLFVPITLDKEQALQLSRTINTERLGFLSEKP